MFKIIRYLKQPLNDKLLGKNNNLISLLRNRNNNYENSIRNISHLKKNLQKHINNEINENSNNNNNIIDKNKKLKILQLELDVSKQEGRKVPNVEFLKKEHWEHILSLGSRSARTKFYTYLWKLEKKKENVQLKKIKRQEELKLRKEKDKIELSENDHIIYGLMHTGFLLRVYDTTINHWNNNKLIQAMQFGQKLIFDCSYDEHMTKREATNTAKQLMLCFAENRVHNEPFDLHFCNINLQNSITLEYLKKHIPTLLEPSFPLNIHTKCFTELFPKNKLVYLTPHCKNDLNEYNPDDLYIIGAIVDKVNNEPLSLAKAKRLGIRMARLPLDKYLQWNSGSGKSLTLNQITNILLDLKTTNDWDYSLRHVPKRKVIDQNEYEEMMKRNNKYHRRANKLKFDIDNWIIKNRIRK